MPERDYHIENEMEERTSQPMAWERVLFLQVNRINEAMTQLNGDFISGIESLDMDLAWFHDEKYHKEMSRLDASANEWLEKQRQVGGYIPNDTQTAAAFARAKEHMKILLRLMGRSGFYPETQSKWKSEV